MEIEKFQFDFIKSLKTFYDSFFVKCWWNITLLSISRYFIGRETEMIFKFSVSF